MREHSRVDPAAGYIPVEMEVVGLVEESSALRG